MKTKKDKILLVSANTHTSPYPVYPLGISYIKSFLEDELSLYDIDVADMNFCSTDELAEKLREGNYRYIGLSLRNIDDNDYNKKNSFINWYKTLSDVIRDNSDGCFVLGGAGYSIFPDILLSELDADYGIKGEGESSLAELIRKLDRGDSVEDIDGLVFRSEGKVVINERKSFASRLALKFEDEWTGFYWEKSGMLNIQTKRGCPNACIYCSYPVIEGRRIRTLDADKIVETLKALNEKHKINYVFFTDSVFNLDRGYNKHLAEKIIESGLKISWGAYFSPRGLTKEELQLYKQSGLTHIEFGTDSFSDTQLLNCRKGFTWNDIKRVSGYCDDLGIFYAHFLILGGYGETDATLDETFRNSAQLTNTVIFPYIGMRVYPDTELFKASVSEGRINGREDLLAPVYYIADGIDTDTLKERAEASGAKWIFRDDGSDEMMERFRAKKRRGPLWEYLRY